MDGFPTLVCFVVVVLFLFFLLKADLPIKGTGKGGEVQEEPPPLLRPPLAVAQPTPPVTVPERLS